MSGFKKRRDIWLVRTKWGRKDFLNIYDNWVILSRVWECLDFRKWHFKPTRSGPTANWGMSLIRPTVGILDNRRTSLLLLQDKGNSIRRRCSKLSHHWCSFREIQTFIGRLIVWRNEEKVECSHIYNRKSNGRYSRWAHHRTRPWKQEIHLGNIAVNKKKFSHHINYPFYGRSRLFIW